MNSPFVDIPLALSMPYQNYAIEPLQSSGGVIGRNTRGETPSNQRVQCSSSNAFELEQLRRPHLRQLEGRRNAILFPMAEEGGMKPHRTARTRAIEVTRTRGLMLIPILDQPKVPVT